MPFLDADALRTDPAGMAFLRSVVGTAPGGAVPEAGPRVRNDAWPVRRGPSPAGSMVQARLACLPPRRPGRRG
jgi:hypothetical protein